MMAKMFYTLEEAKNALGKSEDEIKQYAREGRLREFRDGPRLMFKADQVEQLRGDLGGGDTVDLGVSDSGGMIGLVDTTGASGTSITLTDPDLGQSSGVGMKMKDDTALAADLGLSGSLGGVPSPSRPGGTGSGLTGLSGTSGGARRGGINVFGVDDAPERVDPSAQTAMSGGIREQMNLEGVGSGSGLLDLTRESDDTSLGAVLDEISPSGASRTDSAIVDAGGTGTGVSMAQFDDTAPAVDRRPVAAPVYVQQLDPIAPAFGAMALAGFGALLFGVFVLISALAGTWPDATKYFTQKSIFIPFMFGLGGALVLFVLGMLVGRTARR